MNNRKPKMTHDRLARQQQQDYQMTQKVGNDVGGDNAHHVEKPVKKNSIITCISGGTGKSGNTTTDEDGDASSISRVSIDSGIDSSSRAAPVTHRSSCSPTSRVH